MQTVLALRRLAERKNPAGTVTEEELQSLLQRALDEDMPTAAGPAADGDRRNGLAVDVLWPVDELALHLDSGRYEHAVGMLDYAGGKAPAVESAAAIQACRGRGLTEATDTLLRMVGSRHEKIVFEVVGHLLDVGDVADARALTQIRCGVEDA
jgi:hypothetical protein